MKRILSYSILLTVMFLAAACNKDEVYVRPTPAEGRLNGLFSVGEGRQVYFSQGNLRFNPKQRVYRFADEQYAVLGTENNKIAKDFDGWIDLFGWGTGRNPASYGLVYLFYDKFYEWGDSAVVNGGNVAKAWRTLTDTEWEYLLYKRPRAEAYRGVHTIHVADSDDRMAIIFLPDEWKEPAGLSFSTDSSVFAVGGVKLTIPLADWKKLEKNGAVALPFAGSRIWGNTENDQVGVATLNGFNTYALYWSATPGEDTRSAWSIEAHDSLPEIINNLRPLGISVRLVQDK